MAFSKSVLGASFTIGLALACPTGCDSGGESTGTVGSTGEGGSSAATTSGATTSGATASGATASGAQGSSASTGSGGGASASSSGAGGGCGQCSMLSEMCCGGQCVATYNDINNCGGCGIKCGGAHPFCDNGTCGSPPGGACGTPTNECNAIDTFCCGDHCCGGGQLCCNIDSNVAMNNPQCADPVNGTCPIGCPGCP